MNANNTPSDDALVARLQRGDAGAMEALYDRYADRAFGLAARMLDREAARDVVQEAFAALWQRADQFDRSRGKFAGWFLTSVHRRAIDALRRQRRRERAQQPASELLEAQLQRAPDPGPAPDELAEADRRRGLVIAALKTLPEDQRRALWMAFFDGLTHVEVAEKLRTPLGTVKTRIRTGLRKLKETLEEQGVQP